MVVKILDEAPSRGVNLVSYSSVLTLEEQYDLDEYYFQYQITLLVLATSSFTFHHFLNSLMSLFGGDVLLLEQ
jgi:hypothetical protein